ncbi:hypothetical protein JIR001_09820 [Polycladomyces abyssicola]|uniref:Uncharacterized protein n=1 Tax=Polycladomyces abyssicola TaxID=1125966 RepID=A0A8D5UDT1_9BACL|nr:hypothetical protein JIR001_09820 [Polycladomyces abyssicola]
MQQKRNKKSREIETSGFSLDDKVFAAPFSRLCMAHVERYDWNRIAWYDGINNDDPPKLR